MHKRQKKSQTLRIDNVYRRNVSNLSVNGATVNFVSELKYLGWYILAVNTFKVSLHHMGVCFFQSFNSLYAENSLSLSLVCMFMGHLA